MGINTSHVSGFVFDWKPKLPRKALIMCFRTYAKILTADGMVKAEPGDCIIQDLGSRQYHCSVPKAMEGFRNDWMHLDYGVAFKTMNRLKLPWNKLLGTGNPEIMSEFIKTFISEAKFADKFSDISIENKLLEMLIAISRSARESCIRRNTMSSVERQHYEKFIALRTNMLEKYTKRHTIEGLAHDVILSPERFTTLYKKFFNSTPISDLIDAKILAAKRILSYSLKSINETALECGFSDLHYFSRIFKRRTGYSPAEFRKRRL
jgi:AraC-like DNA-binding protein